MFKYHDPAHADVEKNGCKRDRILINRLSFCGGCSSVGRAPGCGPGGRGFKSRHSPHIFIFMPLFGKDNL